jgi:hypothetical protein
VSKTSAIQQPSETIYLADDEYSSLRAFTSPSQAGTAREEYDVWSTAHLPYVQSPFGVTLSPSRRVGLDRHGKGPCLLYFDGHSQMKDARKIVVYDWRDQKHCGQLVKSEAQSFKPSGPRADHFRPRLLVGGDFRQT